MRISGTGYSPSTIPTPARGTAASTFKISGPAASSNTGSTPDTQAGAQKPDFSHMTRQQMRDWVNNQIASGRMTVDESTPFVSMTMHIPVNGTAMDDDSLTSQYVNFFDLVKQGIAGARARGSQHETQMLMDALKAMEKSKSSGSTMSIQG